jgi:hypothetical protein
MKIKDPNHVPKTPKLTERDVYDIYVSLLKKECRVKTLAEKYNVHSTMISKIKHGAVWGSVVNKVLLDVSNGVSL